MKSLINRKWLYMGLSFVMVFACMAEQCVIDTNDANNPVQFSSNTVQAGDVVTIKMTVGISVKEDSKGDRLVVSILVPKVWKLSEKDNAKVTYTLAGEESDVRPMELISDEISPKQDQWKGMTWGESLMTKYGVVLNIEGSDMEWITFWSEPKDVQNRYNTKVFVTFQLKTSNDNIRCKLALYANNSNDGISNDDERQFLHKLTNCFEVVGAPGSVIDFCEDHPNMSLPMFVEKNDIVTLRYKSGVRVVNHKGDTIQTALYNASEVYLNATAFTLSGATEKSYPVSQTGTKTFMAKEGASSNYAITFWPADYFGIPETEAITRIEYYFTNADQSIYVKKLNDDGSQSPFIYLFECR